MGIILLAGPKHSGKTSAGRALAETGRGRFADLDEAIEARTGKSPRALFLEGSGIFRKAEAEALASLLERGTENAIIAAGGGLADNGEALALLAKRKNPDPGSPLSGGAVTIVYLDVSAETAWERIRGAAETGGMPPFLDTPNPGEAHRLLHTRRAEAYRAIADIIINAENKGPGEIAAEIVRAYTISGVYK
ncbi:MAG: shikimate kinase [Treponema sp.]|jgi:shikimate kinase|nr:shikimate kinase [Treponema sp.]